ncbi:MAG: hypothetical protein QOJ22_279 [Thermoleophilaceae bacterium]|jgi:hypothetical protein|nr:hypothetical protein [Thermoleophilaceae bacterium]
MRRLAGPLAATLILAAAAPAAAGGPLPDFDARRAAELPPAGTSARIAGAARAVHPDVVAQRDALRGGTRVVRRLDGFLTGPSNRDPAAVVFRFLRANPRLFGLARADLDTLSETRRWRSLDGVTHLVWQQRAAGAAAYDNELRAHVTGDGRLVSVGGSPRAGLARAARRARFDLPRDGARRAARRGAGLPADSPVARPRKTLVSHAGRLVPAWRVLAETQGAAYEVLVDARTGGLLRRHNLVRDAGRVSVFEYYPGAPHGGTATERNIGRWLTSDERLAGNLVRLFADVNGDDRPTPNEQIPPSGDGDWLYPFQPFTDGEVCARLICAWDSNKARSWRTNLRSEAAQAFYFTNSFYERLIALGFTERAGNFQQVNASGQGKAGDAIRVLTHYSANADRGQPRELNNAWMYTPPDGQPGELTLLLNSHEGYDTTAGFDAATVYHEATHGLVGRLVVDSEGAVAMIGQGGAINEGLADWFAYSYLNANGSVPDGPGPGEVLPFVAETPNRKGIRYQALDCPVGAPKASCPAGARSGPGGFTYGDYGKVWGEPESHSDGEIFSQTMWDLRSSFIEAYGPDGVERIERLMVSALQLSVPFPSFLDMRNALLDADRVAGGTDRDRIWQAFAARGMGYFASTSIDPEDAKPVQDFTLPPPPGAPVGTLRGTVTDFLTGRPLRGASVSVSGQLTSVVVRTDSRGRFAIRGLVAGTYPLVEVIRPGYDADWLDRLRIRADQVVTRNFELPRDWSSRHSGARVANATGGGFDRVGCGPRAAIDQEPTAWITQRAAGRHVTVKLTRPIDVLLFGIDPGVHCPEGDVDESSSAGAVAIEVAGGNRRFRRVAKARFRAGQNFYTNPVNFPGVLRKVSYVRVRLLRPQGPRPRADEPGKSFGEAMGLGEVEVYGLPARRGRSASAGASLLRLKLAER